MPTSTSSTTPDRRTYVCVYTFRKHFNRNSLWHAHINKHTAALDNIATCSHAKTHHTLPTPPPPLRTMNNISAHHVAPRGNRTCLHLSSASYRIASTHTRTQYEGWYFHNSHTMRKGVVQIHPTSKTIKTAVAIVVVGASLLRLFSLPHTLRTSAAKHTKHRPTLHAETAHATRQHRSSANNCAHTNIAHRFRATRAPNPWCLKWCRRRRADGCTIPGSAAVQRSFVPS